MESTRAKTLLFAIYFCFLAILGRFFYWQIIKGSFYREKALAQSYKLSKIIPDRGLIYSDDNYPMALNQTRYQLSIYKPDLKDKVENVITKIDSINQDFYNRNRVALDKFTGNSNQKWLTLPDLFDSSQVQQIDEPGLSFQQFTLRFYPEDHLARNILGFVNKNEYGTNVGIGGLEAYYNKQLQGKPGFSWTAKDALGKTILSKKGWQLDPVPGRNLHTSLKRNIQEVIETELTDGINKYSADSGSIIVMDPKSGGILAMAGIEATGSASPSASTKISNISDFFEPGSIFKPLVMSMALDTKSVDMNYVCTACDHPLVFGQYTVSNWDNELHPNSSLYDIIRNSDNIGMSSIIKRLGLKNFLAYYQKLGLGQRTGIDLQGESKPKVKQVWPEIDLATASFGQGLAITQIQMIQAFNVIANDGVLVHPRLVSYYDEDGKVIKPKTIEPVKVFQDSTIKNMKDILKAGVENGVVAKFKPDTLEVCAKSGTAQVAIKGGYTDSSTIASYIGFSPCKDPKFTMIVTINNPRTSPWGSSTAAPIWFDLAAKFKNLL